MSTLERAIVVAAVAHAGQVDRAGEPYILHPLRVMLALSDPVTRIVGVLHDVLENCPRWSIEAIGSHGFPPAVTEPLRLLTRPPGLSYPDYIAAVAGSGDAVARAVTIEDIRDNLRRERLNRLPPADRQRLRTRYADALLALDGTEGFWP